MEKQTILMLKGLPASGKSTFAKNLILSEPEKWKRVNRDSLRLMFAEEFNDKNEKFILRIRDAVISQALDDGYNVIIDDLNVSQKHFNRISSLFGKRAEIVVDDRFLNVPLEELLERNRNREESVPEQVIRDLYAQHINGEEKSFSFKSVRREYIQYNPLLSDAYIFDVDGTLALMNGRSPFDWSRVGEDLPNPPVVRICKQYINDESVKVFIVSGRDAECLEETKKWLQDVGLGNHDGIFMRPKGNGEKDSIIKERIFKQHFKDRYNILAVYDDRNQTVEKWRELGLLCLQVAPGNF